MQKLNLKAEPLQARAVAGKKQPLRLMVALVLLLIALSVVIMKDRDFWFGAEDTADSDSGSSGVLPDSAATKPAVVAPAPQTPAADTNKNLIAANPNETNTAEIKSPETKNDDKKVVDSKSGTKSVEAKTVESKNIGNKSVESKPAAKAIAKATQPAATEPAPSRVQTAPAKSTTEVPAATATKRTVLPPLNVEVIASDAHQNVHPDSNATKVEIPGDSNRAATTAANASPSVNAAEHGSLSTGAVPEVRQAIESPMPLLGQHSRVQGSVVLQAVVGVDGSIENLRVISGPAILTTAAQQAVRAWRFKPYLQNGQPVETKARITVNFSIRVSDTASST